MTSVLRRLSDASATSLTCSGRLFWAVQRVFRAGPPLGSGLQPNLVAITTWSRSGASASPTSSSFVKGPYPNRSAGCTFVTFLAMRGVTVPVQQNLRPRGRLGSLVGLQYLE